MKSLLALTLIFFCAYSHGSGPVMTTAEKLGAFEDLGSYCDDGYVTSKNGHTSRYAKCPDGSVSFVQPDDQFNRTGFCGPVAMANVSAMYFGTIDPVGLLDQKYGQRNTIGTPPDDMVRGLNQRWRKGANKCGTQANYRWTKTVLGSRQEFISKLYRSVNWNQESCVKLRGQDRVLKNVWPAIVLLENSNGNLHWVTVVRVEYEGDIDTIFDDYMVRWGMKDSGCRVHLNTWDDQYVADCSEFASRADIGDSVPSKAGQLLHDYEDFTILELVPR